MNKMKPFNSFFCSEGDHQTCKGTLQPIMAGKCECNCHKIKKNDDMPSPHGDDPESRQESLRRFKAQN